MACEEHTLTIKVEGGRGAGKTTMLNHIVQKLQELPMVHQIKIDHPNHKLQVKYLKIFQVTQDNE